MDLSLFTNPLIPVSLNKQAFSVGAPHWVKAKKKPPRDGTALDMPERRNLYGLGTFGIVPWATALGKGLTESAAAAHYQILAIFSPDWRMGDPSGI